MKSLHAHRVCCVIKRSIRIGITVVRPARAGAAAIVVSASIRKGVCGNGIPVCRRTVTALAGIARGVVTALRL